MDPSLHEKWKYEDANPNDGGILLSNRIHQLCTEAGLLISEGYYQPKNLRPASYTLTIGDDFVDSEGNEHHLTGETDSFVFQKNSIIFVSAKEKIDLPYYVIARFNLRVNWVYDGVLLGTGPQVDPGFTGFLSCPLYNLTNVDLSIKRGSPFATIDFEKTTTLLSDRSWEERKTVIQNARDKELVSENSEMYSFYRAAELVPLGTRKSHRIVSSLFEMRENVRTWQRLGIGALIAFFSLTLSLLAFGANLYRQNSDLSRQVAESKNDLQKADEQISRLRDDLDRFSRVRNQNVPSARKTSGQGGKGPP